jgi:hypothetical protein
MAIIYTPMEETLLENTSMELGAENGIAKKYRITPNEGYVLHDNRYDNYAEYDEEGNPIGELVLGYRTSTASCSVRQLVVDDNGEIVTNTYDFYAVPVSSVPADQIFGNVTPETEVMSETDTEVTE